MISIWIFPNIIIFQLGLPRLPSASSPARNAYCFCPGFLQSVASTWYCLNAATSAEDRYLRSPIKPVTISTIYKFTRALGDADPGHSTSPALSSRQHFSRRTSAGCHDTSSPRDRSSADLCCHFDDVSQESELMMNFIRSEYSRVEALKLSI